MRFHIPKVLRVVLIFPSQEKKSRGNGSVISLLAPKFIGEKWADKGLNQDKQDERIYRITN
jgi:hypothetical protein